MCVCVRVRACVSACVCMYVCVCVFVDAKVLDANREAREMFQVYTDRKAEIFYGCTTS